MARFLLALSVFLLVFAGWVFYRQNYLDSDRIITGAGIEIPKENHEFYNQVRPGCPGDIRNLQMDEPYLRGILELGTAYQALMNYYECNPPKTGDVGLYRYSWKFLPVPRQIVAVPGDKIKLKKSALGWEMTINGKVHFGGNQKFIFGTPKVPPPLFAYLEMHQGILQPGHVVVLASFPPGDKDSTIFGVVELRDIVGKVIF